MNETMNADLDLEPRAVSVVETKAGVVSIVERVLCSETVDVEDGDEEGSVRHVTRRTPLALKADALPRIEEALEKLGKACRKLGLPAPSMRVVHRYVVEEKVTRRQHGEVVYVRDPETGAIVTRPSPRFNVAIVGPERVAIPGWRFVARLRHEPGGTMVDVIDRELADANLQAKHRQASPRCDHCGKVRSRKDTYLVADDEGNIVQVGRQCLRDFCGHGSPESVAAMAAFVDGLRLAVSEDEDEGFGRGGKITHLDLAEFLEQVAACVLVDGYVRSGDEGLPTGDRAWLLILSTRRPTNIEEKRELARYGVKDDAVALAARTIAWMEDAVRREDAGEMLDDYIGKLAVAARGGVVGSRSARLVASAVSSYRRHVEREEMKKATASKRPSEWVGKVGERLDLELLVVSVREIESFYGTSFLYRFADEAGNVFTWFASRRQREIEDEKRETGLAARVKARATVKKHDDYKGTKQTVLSRCSLKAIPDDQTSA